MYVYNSTGDFCKFRSVLHMQHTNRVLNNGLSAQQIVHVTGLDICTTLYRTQKFECVNIILLHLKIPKQEVVTLAVWG